MALLRGPLVYSALNFAGPGAPVPRLRPSALRAVSGARQTYRQMDGGQQILFVPFYTVQNETYNVYFERA